MGKQVVAALVGLLMAVALAAPALAQEPGFPRPGVGACIPLPDPPLLDWTIRAIKVTLLGETDCGL